MHDKKTEEAVQRLIDSDISAYRIWKDTGIAKNSITQLRNGERNLENYHWSVVKKLYQYSIKNSTFTK